MTTLKTRIEWVIQARLNGATCYDVIAFKSPKQANKRFDWILARAFPMWRGLTLSFRLIRRVTTIEVETECLYFDTVPRGKKRSYLGEVFVPSWLPKRLMAHYKAIRIPGVPDHRQPKEVVK